MKRLAGNHTRQAAADNFLRVCHDIVNQFLAGGNVIDQATTHANGDHPRLDITRAPGFFLVGAGYQVMYLAEIAAALSAPVVTVVVVGRGARSDRRSLAFFAATLAFLDVG